jgi:hypothetical protein
MVAVGLKKFELGNGRKYRYLLQFLFETEALAT